MKVLESRPAFGFETANCNAANVYVGKSSTLLSLQGKQACIAKNVRIENLMKIIAYIPLIGSVIGFLRIDDTMDSSGSSCNGNRFNHIVRGSIEFLSLGSLLLIPDLIITCYRYMTGGPVMSSSSMAQ